MKFIRQKELGYLEEQRKQALETFELLLAKKDANQQLIERLEQLFKILQVTLVRLQEAQQITHYPLNLAVLEYNYSAFNAALEQKVELEDQLRALRHYARQVDKQQFCAEAARKIARDELIRQIADLKGYIIEAETGKD